MSEVEKQMMIANVLKNVEIGIMMKEGNSTSKRAIIEKGIVAVSLIELGIPISIVTLEKRQ